MHRKSIQRKSILKYSGEQKDVVRMARLPVSLDLRMRAHMHHCALLVLTYSKRRARPIFETRVTSTKLPAVKMRGSDCELCGAQFYAACGTLRAAELGVARSYAIILRQEAVPIFKAEAAIGGNEDRILTQHGGISIHSNLEVDRTCHPNNAAA